ncbi:MAG: sugar phosphate isomerase/epimerase [Victivallaceae bacterium]|nr:sugar phosphate isomerase/epimerase [Victivallaceae bacterium]
MKIGMIAEMLREPLFQSLDTAKAMGATGVQLYAVYGDHNFLEMSDEEMLKIKQHCDKLGLKVSAVCADLGGHGFASEKDNPERIAKTKKIVDKAVLLGAPVLTTHIGVVPADPESHNYKLMADALRECGKYAESKGITLAIETGPEPATRLKKFLDYIGCKGVGVNLDPANLAMVCRDDPAKAAHTLAKYIVHTHAKDGHNFRPCDPAEVYAAFADGGFEKMVKEAGPIFREMPLGQGDVNWDEYMAALKEIGYNGFLTIEREVGDNPKADIAMAIDFLKARI